jgi:hypothetical protein
MIIHNSENKFVQFTLYKPYSRYQREKEYSLGQIAWNDGVYYEYANATPKAGAALSDVVYWTALANKPRYDTIAITGMIIVLYYKGSRNVVAMYSLVAFAGFKDIDGTNAAQSEYTIELTQTLTEKKKEGVLMAEIKLIENNANAETGESTTIISDIHVSEINSPITEFISVPT